MQILRTSMDTVVNIYFVNPLCSRYLVLVDVFNSQLRLLCGTLPMITLILKGVNQKQNLWQKVYLTSKIGGS